jgi:3-oxoacyl-[acyl-carrier-protein] synthase-3
MGTTIESATTYRSRSPRGRRALYLADRAARECLIVAGRDAGELDVLINTGVYREHNLAEPALAALIQEDIGANPGHPPVAGHGTFSFDVDNGACGVLTAAYLLDGFLRSGAIRLGMTVTSDVDPGTSRGYRFPSLGGALLLGWDDGIPGLTDFNFETFSQYNGLFETHVSWKQRRGPRLPGRPGGHSVLTVREEPEYAAQCLDCAQLATEKYVADLGMDFRDVELLLASGPSGGFAGELADRIGIPADRVATPEGRLRRAHTAGPIAAVAAARRSGQLDAARSTLWVAAGAGITVALARYQR